ncbi:Uncharacterized membrane protein YkvA, DUF1232 family [Halopseudomonas salegens]|uniref:Uncharacterized membrane protein YkvA, DUF1232 family n=2 Tax=Halopseudomonas salegens TaxID=1434072 RepID=A0A1H2EP70_9GAMM|nr:Uncharacterized membrane protein YkvA, DUF1232 family [Halopseudomonas salegens]
MQVENSAHAYSEGGFWQKLSAAARLAGRDVVERALWLFYTAKSPLTPAWARATIYAALGYFILPVDAVPDMLPMVGYTDDLAMLVAAYSAVSEYITRDTKAKAKEQLDRWFGPSPGIR